MTIQNSKEASEIILNLLQKQNIKSVFTHHNPSGSHVNLIQPTEIGNIIHHVKFAREPYLTFGYFFKQYKSKYGDSLDEKALDELPNSSILYFAFPNKIYKVAKDDFKRLNLKRKNNSNVWTYSYPLQKMELIYEVEMNNG
jgi:hypothetical protein